MICKFWTPECFIGVFSAVFPLMLERSQWWDHCHECLVEWIVLPCLMGRSGIIFRDASVRITVGARREQEAGEDDESVLRSDSLTSNQCFPLCSKKNVCFPFPFLFYFCYLFLHFSTFTFPSWFLSFFPLISFPVISLLFPLTFLLISVFFSFCISLYFFFFSFLFPPVSHPFLSFLISVSFNILLPLFIFALFLFIFLSIFVSLLFPHPFPFLISVSFYLDSFLFAFP